MKWEYKTLDQLGTVSRGKSKHRPRNDPKLFGGKYPFIQTADVKNADYYITKYSDTYNESGLAQSKLWDKGTLCITIAANIADTGVLAFPACFPDSIMGFVPFEGVANTRFIKYCFDRLQRDCKQISQGTAQDNLSWEKLSTIKFCIPEYKEQCRIADILSAYDDLIENNQKQIKLLEEAAQRLYKEWFVDLRFPGHENTKIVDGVPEEWRKFPLEEIAPVVTGKKDANYGDKGGNYPFFTCSQETITAPGYSFDTSAVILAGNGDFNVKLYRGKFEAYQRTYVLAPFDHSNLFNLYFTVQDNMEALAKGASGSTIKFLTKGMLQKILVLTADKKILDKFNDYEENIQQKVEALKKQVEDLTEIRNRLLPKLMSGEVEV